MSSASGQTTSEFLQSVLPTLRGVDVSRLEPAELEELLVTARRSQAAIQNLICKLSTAADGLAKQGRCAPGHEFLAGQGAVSNRTAKVEHQRARTLDSTPQLRNAVEQGQTSFDHVDSLTRHLNRLPQNVRSKLDTAHLTKQAIKLPVDRFDRAVKRAVDAAKADEGLDDANRKRAASEFHHWFNHKTGMGHIKGILDPERYEALTTAIDQHVASLANTSPKPTTKDANLAAEAIVDLVCSSGRRSQNVPHITVVADQKTLTHGQHLETICETGNGHELPVETVARLSCDSTLQKVVLDTDGLPVNVGRKYRTATDTQWAAIRSIYRHCSWADCDRPLSWCQLHHIQEWKDGGRTDLENLVPLCSEHHHRVHEGKWHIKIKPDRSLEIRQPDGNIYRTTRPPSRNPSLPQRPRSSDGSPDTLSDTGGKHAIGGTVKPPTRRARNSPAPPHIYA